jgi:hypothetical protein
MEQFSALNTECFDQRIAEAGATINPDLLWLSYATE